MEKAATQMRKELRPPLKALQYQMAFFDKAKLT
jgi:hypothetical protein